MRLDAAVAWPTADVVEEDALMSGCMPTGSALRGAAAEVVSALTEAATRTGCAAAARASGLWFTTGHPGRGEAGWWHAPFLQPVAPWSASG